MTDPVRLAALVATGVLLAFSPPAGPVRAAGRLVFDTEHITLDRVEGVAPARATFPMANEGDAPVEVLDLGASCGCLATLLSTPVLQPGERGEIVVSLDPSRLGGRPTKVVTVYSTDPERPVQFLKLTADIRHPVDLSDRVVSFGQVGVGDARTRTLIVFQRPEAPVTLARATAGSPLLSVTWRHKPEETPPAYVVTIRLAPGASPGAFADTVRLAFAEAAMPTVEVPVRAQIQGPVIAEPAVLGLGLLRPGTSPERDVHVTAPTLQHFRVEKVECTSVHLVPTVVLDEPGVYRVTVHVGPEAPKRALQALLRVYTNAREMPLVEVPVTAIVR